MGVRPVGRDGQRGWGPWRQNPSAIRRASRSQELLDDVNVAI